MWKTSFTIFFLLMFVVGGILFWQWDAYSKQTDSAPKGKMLENVEQQVIVESRKNSIQITQTLFGLTSGKEYRVSIPEHIKNWTCINEDGSECDSQDENPFSFISENGYLTLKFLLPMDKSSNAKLYKNWIASFPDVVISNSLIEIVDYKREGSWVSGLPLKGYRELDIINYYVFEGELAKASLYWQSDKLNLIKDLDYIAYYSEKATNDLNNLFNTVNDHIDPSTLGPFSVVFTDQFKETSGQGMIIAKPTIKKSTLERKIVYASLENRFETLPKEEKWIIDAFASLTIGKSSKFPKGNELIAALQKNLTDEELLSFTKLIWKEPTLIHSKKLDKYLGEIKGMGTHFFTLNKSEKTKFISLYFYDLRNVMVQEKIQKNMNVVYRENQKLFPFLETMGKLGFDVQVLSDEETLLLNKGNNRYRFYLNQNIFIYNEEDYGLLENPLLNLNGIIFMEEKWLQKLFNVSVEEDSQNIRLSL